MWQEQTPARAEAKDILGWARCRPPAKEPIAPSRRPTELWWESSFQSLAPGEIQAAPQFDYELAPVDCPAPGESGQTTHDFSAADFHFARSTPCQAFPSPFASSEVDGRQQRPL